MKLMLIIDEPFPGGSWYDERNDERMAGITMCKREVDKLFGLDITTEAIAVIAESIPFEGALKFTLREDATPTARYCYAEWENPAYVGVDAIALIHRTYDYFYKLFGEAPIYVRIASCTKPRTD